MSVARLASMARSRYAWAPCASALLSGSIKESTKLASPRIGMNSYFSWTPLGGTELGPECDVITASVVKASLSEIATKPIAGIRILNEVEPVSTLIFVVTLTRVPISVLAVLICDPAKCLIGPIGLGP